MKKQNASNQGVSRKEALKKIGYGAFTVSTMMYILNGNAQGEWDDVNHKNGFKGATISNKANKGPSASPCECKAIGTRLDDTSWNIIGGSGSFDGTNISLAIQVQNTGSCKCPKTIENWRIDLYSHNKGWSLYEANRCSGSFGPVAGGATDTLIVNCNGATVPSGKYKIELLLNNHGGTAKWTTEITV